MDVYSTSATGVELFSYEEIEYGEDYMINMSTLFPPNNSVIRNFQKHQNFSAIIRKKWDNCDEEFSVQEIAEISREHLPKPFSSSHINQMLSTLTNNGLVYKNRYGKYSFAVPLLGDFILRQP